MTKRAIYPRNFAIVFMVCAMYRCSDFPPHWEGQAMVIVSVFLGFEHRAIVHFVGEIKILEM